MPTGYTADIAKDIDFNTFVLGCARAFGALIEMRDLPNDAEIREQEPSNYHLEALKKAEEEIQSFHLMSDDDFRTELEQRRLAFIRSNIEYMKERSDLKKKYETMLEKVCAWNPPSSDHVNMKEFMIQQIEESIKFDCSDYSPSVPKPIEDLEAERQSHLESLEHDAEYHREQYAKDIERCERNNTWIRQLRGSL
jgi:hypothetical protein